MVTTSQILNKTRARTQREVNKENFDKISRISHLVKNEILTHLFPDISHGCLKEPSLVKYLKSPQLCAKPRETTKNHEKSHFSWFLGKPWISGISTVTPLRL